MFEYVDLVMANGELVRIECLDKYSDELYESLDNAKKRGDWWSPNMFDGCKAEYMGLILSRVSMKDVVAIL